MKEKLRTSLTTGIAFVLAVSLGGCDNDENEEKAGQSCTPEYQATMDGQFGIACINGSLKITECGDGRIEGAEQCEGRNIVNASCSDVGGEGTVVCSRCLLDYSGCHAANVSEKKCGNGVIEQGEQCDGNTVSCSDLIVNGTGQVVCTSDCKYDFSNCRVNVSNPEPEPQPEPYCGDGVINDNEECEGDEIGSVSCVDKLGEGATGNVVCVNCKLDYSDCKAAEEPQVEPYCGDGVINDNEECEGDEIGSVSCVDKLGEGATGNVVCVNCKLDYSDCKAVEEPQFEPYCGDGIINNDEECEGDDIGTASCEDKLGEGATGNVKCKKCKLDFTGCKEKPYDPALCGNGVLDRGEICDGEQFADISCGDILFGSSGVLTCSQDCKVETSGCEMGMYCGMNDGKEKKYMRCIDQKDCEKGTCDRGICVTEEMNSIKDYDPCDKYDFVEFCNGDRAVYCNDDYEGIVLSIDCSNNGGCVLADMSEFVFDDDESRFDHSVMAVCRGTDEDIQKCGEHDGEKYIPVCSEFEDESGRMDVYETRIFCQKDLDDKPIALNLYTPSVDGNEQRSEIERMLDCYTKPTWSEEYEVWVSEYADGIDDGCDDKREHCKYYEGVYYYDPFDEDDHYDDYVSSMDVLCEFDAKCLDEYTMVKCNFYGKYYGGQYNEHHNNAWYFLHGYSEYEDLDETVCATVNGVTDFYEPCEENQNQTECEVERACQEHNYTSKLYYGWNEDGERVSQEGSSSLTSSLLSICMKGDDGKYYKVYDETACGNGCDSVTNKCKKTVEEEGELCNTQKFNSYCVGNTAVYCDDNYYGGAKVFAEQCPSNKTCVISKSNEFYNPHRMHACGPRDEVACLEECDEEGAVKKVCEISDTNLDAQEWLMDAPYSSEGRDGWNVIPTLYRYVCTKLEAGLFWRKVGYTDCEDGCEIGSNSCNKHFSKEGETCEEGFTECVGNYLIYCNEEHRLETINCTSIGTRDGYWAAEENAVSSYTCMKSKQLGVFACAEDVTEHSALSLDKIYQSCGSSHDHESVYRTVEEKHGDKIYRFEHPLKQCDWGCYWNHFGMYSSDEDDCATYNEYRMWKEDECEMTY